MITDRIQLAGLDSYFQHPSQPGRVDVGGLLVTMRTKPLQKGIQHRVSGIDLLIEASNLKRFLSFQLDNQNLPAPLFSVSVIKEMFPGLFSDPFRHRVHNIAGFVDFNEGKLTNGKVMEVDGVPTIVSTGKDLCVWKSREYELPQPISIDAIAWEFATSRKTNADAFHYKILITSKDITGNQLPPIDISNGGQFLKADSGRAVNGLMHSKIKNFQIEFTARVYEDAFLMERHLPGINEKMGRPLLRAINILEPVNSVFDIHSLTELKAVCSDFHLLENPGPSVKGLVATIDLGLVLVYSVNQTIAPAGIYDPASNYEHIEVKILTKKFDRFEAKMNGEEHMKLTAI